MSSEDGSLINSIPLADNLDMVTAGGLAVLSEENLDHSEILIIKNFSLGSVYPNPFNPIANIQYSLSESAKIKLAIYDVSGRLVDTYNINGITKVLPDEPGKPTETHFVYPASLKDNARLIAFRNFLFSKVNEWKF